MREGLCPFDGFASTCNNPFHEPVDVYGTDNEKTEVASTAVVVHLVSSTPVVVVINEAETSLDVILGLFGGVCLLLAVRYVSP